MNLRWRLTMALTGFALAVIVGASLLVIQVQVASLEREYDRRVQPAAKNGAAAIDPKSFARLAQAREAASTEYKTLESSLRQFAREKSLAELRVFARDANDQPFLVFALGQTVDRGAIWEKVSGILSTGMKSALWGRPAVDPFASGRNGRLFMSGYAPIMQGQRALGFVACTVDAQPAQAARSFLLRYVMGAAICVWIACFVAAFFLASWMADPLLNLAEQARRVQRGDLTTPGEESNRDDEWGLVAKALNQLRHDLRHLVTRVNDLITGVDRQAESIRAFAESLNQTAAASSSAIEDFGQEGRRTVGSVTDSLCDLQTAGGDLESLDQQVEGIRGAVLDVQGLVLAGAGALKGSRRKGQGGRPGCRGSRRASEPLCRAD